MISIIIPFYNEAETVTSVLEEVVRTNPTAEVIAVNDGSSDSTWEIMQGIAGIRSLNAPENRGQSAALYAGLRQATGEICVMMDGDGR